MKLTLVLQFAHPDLVLGVLARTRLVGSISTFGEEQKGIDGEIGYGLRE